MKKLLKSTFTIPFAIVLLSIAAYGLLIPTLGYYWDDWPLIWLKHALNNSDFIKIFSVDRPFLAVIYTFTTSLFGERPLSWQIFALVSRILTSVAAWWTLSKLWPEKKEQVGWIALLFAIYPGFKQQPISVVYSNGFMLFLFYMLSLGLMLYAVNKPKKFWIITIPSVILYITCTFSTEYYIGLDMIRPFLIWIALGRSVNNARQKIVLTVKNWAPYLLALIVFLIWRVFIFKFPTYQPVLIGAVETNIGQALLSLVERVVNDILTTGWSTWIRIFNFPQLSDFSDLSGTVYWILVIVSIPLLYLYVSKFIKAGHTAADTSGPENGKRSWGLQAMFIGAVGLFFAGWPYWITDLPIALEYPLDRFTLAFMLGSSIFIIGLIDWLFRVRFQKILLLSVILALSIGTHFQNANTYRREWATHNDFFWQLVWRVPALKEDTVLLTHMLPISYYSDNSLTAPLNWTYAPDYKEGDLPYLMVFSDVRLGGSLPDLNENVPILQSYRGIPFISSTDNTLTFFYSPPRCLQIMDPQRDIQNPLYPEIIREAIKISHLDQIDLTSDKTASLPENIFGKEPAHTWCYYYQKIELSRQKNDWKTAVALAEEAFKQGYHPSDATEYLPLIESYARSGDWDRALSFTNEAYQKEKVMEMTLCQLVSDLQNENTPAPEQNDAIINMLRVMGCN